MTLKGHAKLVKLRPSSRQQLLLAKYQRIAKYQRVATESEDYPSGEFPSQRVTRKDLIRNHDIDPKDYDRKGVAEWIEANKNPTYYCYFRNHDQSKAKCGKGVSEVAMGRCIAVFHFAQIANELFVQHDIPICI